MSFESFYGGRMGASFIIVKQFDGIDIEPNTVHKIKIYATNGDENNLLYYIDENNQLIEKNSSNYTDYIWTYTELNNSTIHTIHLDETAGSDITLPNEYAEGMIQCFEQGGDSTNKVNYGEYVIIDTYFGLCRRDDPDNGKVFRRGMNYQGELAGAEYVGQIVGPQGECTDIEITHYNDITSEPHQYTVGSNDLIPGKYDESGEPQYNDAINYKYVNLRDNYGNIDKALIGFQIPYFVAEIIGRQRSAYDNNGDILPSDFELVERIDNAQHPFYQKWQINIPHGIKGDVLKDLEIYPTMAKEGAVIYSDAACTTSTGQTVGIGGLPLDTDNYDDGDASLPLVGGNYVKLTDGEKYNIRYKQYNYDNRVEGQYHYEDLGEYNMISDIELDNDGTLTVSYTNHTDKVFNKTIQWITDVNVSVDGDLGIHYNTNDIIDPSTPGYYDYEAILNCAIDFYVVPVNSSDALRGHLLVYYSDPDKRNDPSNPIKDRTYKNVKGWTDLGDIGFHTDVAFTFGHYASFEQIPSDPPETIMHNSEFTGWGALYDNNNTLYIAIYDYLNNQWMRGTPYNADTEPSLTIDYNSAQEQLINHGFRVDRGSRTVVNETLSNGVVNQLSKKNVVGSSVSYDSTPIGTEVKYIGAQRNSNNNNLEEQLIIGTDAHSTIVYSDVNNEPNKIQKVETILFNANNSANDYYKIEKTIVMDKPIQIDTTNKKLILKTDPYIYSHNEELTYHNSGSPTTVSTKLTTYTDNLNTKTRTISADITNSL